MLVAWLEAAGLANVRAACTVALARVSTVSRRQLAAAGEGSRFSVTCFFRTNPIAYLLLD